ncbi:MAG: acyltransferase [Muribaculaceae bacterium]|nr:acyltransferase [Muribaculaceae bacterium]
MDILVVILFLLCLYGIRLSYKGHSDYLGRSQTDSVKGIFAIIILFSHMRGYLPPPSGNYDVAYYGMLDCLGQLMVVMFLFYSGYGIMEALRRDIRRYSDNFLTHRLLKVWLMFAIAVSLYLLLNIVLQRDYGLKTVLMSYMGWESIGNSNWFVFDIMVLYLFTYMSLKISAYAGLNLKSVALIVALLSLALCLMFIRMGKGAWWYDTVLAYPIGMYYSLYKDKIERIVSGHRWYLAVTIVVLVFTLFYMRDTLVFATIGNKVVAGYMSFTAFLLTSGIFALLLVLLSMKIKIDNKILRWLGVNAFAIYILQRLAMIAAAHMGWNRNSLVFAAIVIPVTLLVSAVFTAATGKINRALFH